MLRAELSQPAERGTIHLTYPGNYSPVEAGQLGVVIGNLFFDNPGEQADRCSQASRPGAGHRVSATTSTTQCSEETLPLPAWLIHTETFTLCKSRFPHGFQAC